MNNWNDYQDLIETTLKNRAASMVDVLTLPIYSGWQRDIVPRTKWQRARDRITTYRWRIVNAWLVLTGKADIE